MFQIINLSFTV